MDEKRILVTGASGFVGINALGPLAERGFEIHAVSRSPAPPTGAAADWHRADLLDRGQARALIETVSPSHLLHLAWVTTPGEYWTSPINGAWAEAGRALIAAFAAAGGRRAVIAGSCAEYEWNDAECDERTTPLRPTTPYGEAKLALFRELSKRPPGEVSIAWARLFFLFGAHEHPDRLVPSVIRSVLAGNPAPITSGEQVRDFLSAGEAGSALAALLDGDAEGAVNVASGEPVTVLELARLAATAAGDAKLLRPGAIERPTSDPDRITATVARLRDEVGWLPRQTLSETIRETAGWWRARGGRGQTP